MIVLNNQYIKEHESIPNHLTDKDVTIGVGADGKEIKIDVGLISNGVLDSNIKHRIEDYNETKEKAILESKDIVKAYQLFLDCEIDKMLALNSSMESTKWIHGLADNMSMQYNLAKKQMNWSDDQVRKEIKDGGYIENLKDPQAIKNLLKLRQNYCNGIVRLLQEMIKVNYKILGIDIQTANTIASGLSNQSTRKMSMEQIREIMNKNKSKFMKKNCIDLRSVGGGICYNGDDEYLEGFDKIKNLDNLLQELLSYDVIIMHHGADYKIDDNIIAGINDINYKKLLNEKYKKELDKYYDDNFNVSDDKAPTLNGGWFNVLNAAYGKEYKDFCKVIRVKYNENDTTYMPFYNYCKKIFADMSEDLYDMSNDETSSKNVWAVATPIYTDGGSFLDMNKLVKWCISDTERYRKENNIQTNKPVKIKILSCNPGGHKLDPEITNRKDVVVRYSLYGNFVESSTEEIDDLYYSINETLLKFDNMIDSYSIINEDYYIAEGALSNAWKTIVAVAKEIIGLIIDAVKKFIQKIKELILKIKNRFKKLKEEFKEPPSYKVSTSYIKLEAATVATVSANSYDDLEKQILKSIDSITKELNKRTKQQTDITNKIKNMAERNMKATNESYICWLQDIQSE